MSPDGPLRRAVAALAASVLALPATARGDEAQAPGAVAAPPAERPGRALWELGAGIGGAVTPAYPGSSETTVRVLPLPVVAYRGRFLRAGDGSLVTGRLFRNERLEFDISLNGSFDADSDDVDARAGMPDLGFLFEVGPELEWRLNDPTDPRSRWKLELPLRAAFSLDDGDLSQRGLVFSPELELERPAAFGPGTELSFSVASSWAGGELMDYFYGVPAAFANPGRPAFDARSGYLQSTFGITLTQRRKRRLAVLGLRLHSHHGARNEASPLFEENFTWSVFAAVAWSLWESERRAPGR